jgi:hypothetical protein
MKAPQKTRGRRSVDEIEDKPSGRSRTRGQALEPSKGRAVGSLAKQLEEQAEAAASMERGAPMGRNFSFKGGQMVFDGAPVKENEVVVIIAGAVIAKTFYEGDYDPDNPEAPVCFAFDTDPDNLAPIPEDVADLQNDVCATCEWNQFGSADRGKGKACKDARRLALLPAGTIQRNGDIDLVEDPNELAKAEFGFAVLPPTSLTPYATFVRQVANTMKRPPHGIYAIMKCNPDPKNQFVISWEVVDLVPEKTLAAVMERHDEAQKALIQPYTYPSEEERAERAKPARGKGKSGGRASSRTSERPARSNDDKPAMRSRTGGKAATGGRQSSAGGRSRKY